ARIVVNVVPGQVRSPNPAYCPRRVKPAPMMRYGCLLIIAAVGCGRFHFDEVRPDGATTCTSWSPFSNIAVLPGPVQSSSDDWAPTPTRGGLAILPLVSQRRPTRSNRPLPHRRQPSGDHARGRARALAARLGTASPR